MSDPGEDGVRVPTEKTQRRLAAVVAADVAGYSRLMGEDEDATMRAWWSYRAEIIDPTMAAFRGRIVKLTGDGFLAEFASVLDAVRWSLKVQTEIAARNAEIPSGRRMEFRMGINVCDILADEEDIYGDGVNIAARVEALADAGGICVTGRVYEDIVSKLDLSLEDLGDRNLKNIARPVRVYRVRVPGELPEDSPVPPDDDGDTKSADLPEKPSIAVLPFSNMSHDPEQEYFTDGITEDIITDLSKVSGLFVIARNSVFIFKGKSVDLREVGQALGVRYVVEGSVRKAGNRVRVTAQLIDAGTGGHLWAERYDRDLTDIFAVQDEVAQEIVNALKVKLTRDEQRRLPGRGTESVQAYDLVLRGRELAMQHRRDLNPQARALFERAIELDPNFAAALAFLSFTHSQDYVNEWSDAPEQSLQQAYDLAQRAVAIDENEIQAHFVLGIAHLWMRQHDEAIEAAQRTIALDPNFAHGYGLLGNVLHYAGRSVESLEALEKLMRLDPYFADLFLHFLAQDYFALGRYEDAVDALNRRLMRNPHTDISRVLLAACYGHLGRSEEARAMWEEALRINPAYSLEHRRKILPYKNPADFEQVVEGLRKAGIVA